MKIIALSLAALLATTAGAANAASIGLSTNYSVEYVKNLGTREAGAVSFNWDTNRLMVVGDENNWDEYGLDGVLAQRVLAGSTINDPEGLAYYGGGKLVVAQERRGKLSLLSEDGVGSTYRYYTGDTDSPSYTLAASADGSFGLEGVSYDRRTGDFYLVKEDRPQGIWQVGDVDFAAGTGTATMMFDIEALGLETLSDISVLANSDAFFGTAFGDNLLVLSATSQLLIEITKAGDILSSYNLAGIGTTKIEGVTVDNDGNIYLVGETGPNGISSGIIKLARANVAAVPEPATWAMLIAGFAMVGSTMRRRKTSVSFA